MKKVCHNCKKSFTPAHNRKEGKYCTISCYQNNRSNKSKFNWSQFAWDGALLIVPIGILAFSIFALTPKDKTIKIDKDTEIVLEELPDSSCDEFCCFDENDDAKVLEAILSKRKKK